VRLLLCLVLSAPTLVAAKPSGLSRPFLVQVDRLNAPVLLHGSSPQSAVRRYGLDLLRSRIFPKEKNAFRRWMWKQRRSARQKPAQSLQDLRRQGKPLIGVQINDLDDLYTGNRLRPSGAQQTARHIRRAGGIPVFLLPAGNPKLIDRQLASIDHLVLLGGADIDPSLYGRRKTHAVRVKPRRDRYELQLVRRAMAKGLGIDGICRGMQLLNVAAGGTLHQDLHKDRATRKWHRFKLGSFSMSLPHSITLDPGSATHRVLGNSRFRAMSFHHQGLDRIGRGLQVTGRARDGIAEVLESNDGRLRGYQFHPEKSWSSASNAIFADMVKRAAAYSQHTTQ
jgi:putative glutamine amidotransferase